MPFTTDEIGQDIRSLQKNASLCHIVVSLFQLTSFVLFTLLASNTSKNGAKRTRYHWLPLSIPRYPFPSSHPFLRPPYLLGDIIDDECNTSSQTPISAECHPFLSQNIYKYEKSKMPSWASPNRQYNADNVICKQCL
jgi:hypothetical protein